MKKTFLVIFVSIFIGNILKAQEGMVSASWIRDHVIENPINPSWVRRNLKEDSPKLFLKEKLERKLKQSIESEPLAKNYFKLLQKNADAICEQPLLEREVVGRRLLGVSREAVRRIGTLALVYRINGDDKYLDRVEAELNAVSQFSDWNPSHFLDVAEMSYAVSLGLDWCGEELSESTINRARTALREKALKISLEDEGYNWWINAHHNWNQVCHAGLSAAAIVLGDEHPELASKILSRAVNKLPLALEGYSPDGAYPEGPGYWGYGTSYNLVAISMYRSAFGTDFNLPESPGFMESATYRLMTNAPSGLSFNYSDAGLSSIGLGTWGILSWFAQETGNGLYLDEDKFLSLTKEALRKNEELSRLASAALIWMNRIEKEKDGRLPVYWKGNGKNPIAVFRAGPDENTGFYLGVKGGSASVNHGNMDVGSFILELGGVRWSIDPGSQSYHELEQIMGDGLWDESQDGERWTLLTKNNYNHSTLSVDGELHRVEGYAPIDNFSVNQSPPSVELNLQEIFDGQLMNATRRFVKENGRTLRIIDEIVPGNKTEKITWRMMTRAHVRTTDNGAFLTQDNKELKMKINEPSDLQVSVVSMDPPPLPYDKKMEGLKRIEIQIPAYTLEEYKVNTISVTLQLQD